MNRIDRNYCYRDAYFDENGSILWLDDDRGGWVWQATDDESADAQPQTVAVALAYVGPQFRGWILEQTFDALIGFNAKETMEDLKATAASGMTDSAPWLAALQEMTLAAHKFTHLAEELIAATRSVE